MADPTAGARLCSAKRRRERLERWALGTAWALKPQRIGGLPGAWPACGSPTSLRRAANLPDPENGARQAGRPCGMVHDLSVPTLVEAYGRGLFTFAHFGPLKWYLAAERCVLFFDEIHIGKKLRRRSRQGRYQVTFDRDFEGVIKACAGRRDGKWHVTWITPRIMHAYAALFDAGHVAFVRGLERRRRTGRRRLRASRSGTVFFTESQFSLRAEHLEDRLHGAQLASREMGLSRSTTASGRRRPFSTWDFAQSRAGHSSAIWRTAERPAPARAAAGRASEADAGAKTVGSGEAAEGATGAEQSLQTETQERAAAERRSPRDADYAVVRRTSARSTLTKKPSVSVRRGVISNPSSDMSAACRNTTARSPSTLTHLRRRDNGELRMPRQEARAPARRSPRPAPSR